VTQLVVCREEKRLQRLHKKLQRLYFLVIDELGYVPFSKVGAELLFEAIGQAYEHHSLMLTTNLAFEEWDGGLWFGTAHRCAARPAHTPMSHHRSEWGKLSIATGQKTI
jgi:DNA replication protein DnaC